MKVSVVNSIRLYNKNFPLRAERAKGKGKQLFVFQECVDLCEKLVAINTVNGASLFNGLTAGRGAAQTMHADGQEHGSSLRSDVQNIADNGILGDFDHGNLPPK